jgi:DNA-binding NarL/FixJ family response regulator
MACLHLVDSVHVVAPEKPAAPLIRFKHPPAVLVCTTPYIHRHVDYATDVALATEVARLGNSAASTKVVVVAGIDREWEIRSALERGVRGYLLVGCPLDELAAGERAVRRGACSRALQPMTVRALADQSTAYHLIDTILNMRR